LPLFERTTTLDGAEFGKQKVMVVDGVGFFVRYSANQENQLTPERLRCYLMCRQRTWCFLRARTAAHAIQKFLALWDGANTGGTTPERNALWIDTQYADKLAIEELPVCEHLYLDRRDMPKCGRWGGRVTTGCVLDGCDPPEDCPVDGFKQKMNDLGDAVPVEIVMGHRVIRACKLAGGG
jgi:hypothetical protein